MLPPSSLAASVAVMTPRRAINSNSAWRTGCGFGSRSSTTPCSFTLQSIGFANTHAKRVASQEPGLTSIGARSPANRAVLGGATGIRQKTPGAIGPGVGAFI
ncbi:hypothetical protein GCM10009550_41530 [Actinocorallia libanotica]|uniref:Uncharacterized protein n=1 Tax=Actinocorallia libanotica TaxID=46162 RepID=A0ABP4BW88_9ACTN